MLQFKQIALLFLSLTMLVKSLVVPLICLDYELRKEFIIKNYCVNKNRPELHCDGKCFLAKKVKAETEKEEQSALGNFIYKLIEVNTFDGRDEFCFDNVVEIKLFVTNNYSAQQEHTLDVFSSVFHPPAFQ